MNRRDTIIVAILLNAGLLVVLFTTSLKSKSEETPPPSVVATHEPAAPAVIVPPSSALATPAAPDEVDQVLKQYITPVVTNEPQQNVATEVTLPAPIEEPSVKEVTVKKGDVLERIARQNRVSVSELMKFNHLTTTRLKVGQVLKIPAKMQKASVQTETGAEYYTVKNGDNPWVIAVRHHMKVEELLQLNNMDEAKARRLKPGDRIRIR